MQIDIHSVIDKLFHSEKGSMVLSGLFGITLAIMFKRVCKGRDCIIIKPPPLEEINGTIYQIDGDCYKYTPKIIKCSESPASVNVK